ncbi:MAG TPA: M35 family metallo-endopeptidase [Thermoanaerobaculia bacterium]|nr:M35 family metallo-endopeptidase [Thermoanaerobaculia bacterium]
MSKRFLALSIAAACLVTLLAAAPASAKPRLESTLEIENGWLGAQEDVVVHFSLANLGTSPAHVLSWQTPVAGVEANLFAVSLDGRPVPYLGRLVKRATPTAQDYLTIGPGESISARVELSALYDLTRAGEYAIQYRASLQDGFGGPAVKAISRPIAVESNAVSFYRAEDGLPLGPILAELDAPLADGGAPQLGLRYLTPTYVGCSSTRQSSLVSALSQAQTYAINAAAYLTAGTVGPRYTTWFGTYKSSRYSSVRSHFNSISSTIQTKTIQFDCSTCTINAYAYVYANQPYRIYLCSVFWSAPTQGTDSKAGTIIHELSHFNVVAATDDWAYGQTACKSLATSNPGKAVDNADSHEYFAENTPSQN